MIRTPYILLLGRRFLRTRRLLDVYNQLCLGLVLVDWPRRQMHAIVVPADASALIFVVLRAAGTYMLIVGGAKTGRAAAMR